MEKSKSRHKLVSGLICGYCGKEFSAREQRVRVGLGKFCSHACFAKSETLGKDRKYVGKENACVRFDKTSNRCVVYWFDPITLKRKTSTYARWWWETNKGEIPKGYRASYRDGNIVLISPVEYGKQQSHKLLGRTFSDETKRKMSVSGKRKHLSDEHKNKIGEKTKQMWDNGKFESVHVGSNHRLWKGGVKPYPRKFSVRLKYKIKHRDGFLCRCCGADVYGSRFGHVHHIDGDKQNCDEENLVLVCQSCHNAIHGKSNLTSDKIEFYKSKLAVKESR